VRCGGALRLRHESDREGGAGNVSIADRTSRAANAPPDKTQAVSIRAALIGDTCTALGIAARGSAPVLALCRELVAAGFDPALSLEGWRGETLCLRVRSIGEGSRLTVENDRHGKPRLRRWRHRDRGCGAGPSGAQIADGLAVGTDGRPDEALGAEPD